MEAWPACTRRAPGAVTPSHQGPSGGVIRLVRLRENRGHSPAAKKKNVFSLSPRALLQRRGRSVAGLTGCRLGVRTQRPGVPQAANGPGGEGGLRRAAAGCSRPRESARQWAQPVGSNLESLSAEASSRRAGFPNGTKLSSCTPSLHRALGLGQVRRNLLPQ